MSSKLLKVFHNKNDHFLIPEAGLEFVVFRAKGDPASLLFITLTLWLLQHVVLCSLPTVCLPLSQQMRGNMDKDTASMERALNEYKVTHRDEKCTNIRQAQEILSRKSSSCIEL